MKLKKLTINGFKSFADKIAIHFDCEIIAIVGPNGCGKSNIVDAFRWVMGEQSAKSLRGERMHDVLFAGTEERKALNYAEVSVLLSELNGELSLPYDEVLITRRLYRSGESEYFLNKELVRLRDLQNLLMGSGLGKNAFSVFEQGKLDQIIHLSPLERRVIFDEAAGTSRFLQRKKESVRKLEIVNENLLRVNDIHAEIERQTKQLKKQALKANTYQENKLRLESLEKGLLVTRWNHLNEEQMRLLEHQTRLVDTIKKLHIQLSKMEEAFQESRESTIQEENILNQHHRECNQSITNARLVESEINHQKTRLMELKQREKGCITQLQEHSLESSNLREMVDQSQQQIEAVSQKKEELQKQSQGQRGVLLQLEERLKQVTGALKMNQAKHLKELREESASATELQQKKTRYENGLNRFEALKRLQVEYQNDMERQKALIDKQKQKIKQISEQIDLLKSEYLESEKAFQNLRREEHQGNQEREKLLKAMTERESQWKTLNRLKEDMEGFSLSAKKILSEAKNKKSPLYQKVEPLFEYLEPKKGYEETLACAMRAYAETLLVESEENFSLLIEHAKTKNISDFSVVIRNQIPSSGCLDINSMTSHFTKNLKLVEGNHFFDDLGVYFHVGKGDKIDNVFLRQAEMKSIEKDLEELQKEFQQLHERNQHILEALKLSEKRRGECFESQKKWEMDLVKENFHLQHLLGAQEDLRQEISQMDQEKGALSQLLEEVDEIAHLERKQMIMREQIQATFDIIKENEEKIEKETEQILQARQKAYLDEQLYQEAQLNWHRCEQEIKIHQAKLQHIKTHEMKLTAELDSLKKLGEQFVTSLSAQENEAHLLKQRLHALKMAINEQEIKVNESRKKGESLEQARIEQRNLLSNPEKEQHSLEITLAKLVSEKQGVESELHNRFALHSSATLSAHPLLEVALDVAMQEIHQIRLALDAAGTVNLTAIEEFKATQERFDDLDKQLKDLQESKQDLIEMIQRLDQESRKIFKKTFNQIRQNFQKNFAILFSGGVADMTITESSDVLEAGIEIVVKPPGKQLKALSLLSGGEKCLTALALLFSIFEVKPAPFCILDEVDAPLDDTNIGRFTEMLKQFTDKTQFIVVTHNKKTMSIADLLIGVSMEEKGISKLISLTFERKSTQDKESRIC